MTHNSRGFTLIELMLIIAILGLAAAILLPPIIGHQARPEPPKPETICKAGYQFVVLSWYGSTPNDVVQLINEEGTGVRCPETVNTEFSNSRPRDNQDIHSFDLN
jgi:prepilin-type N-terminal cleavage/methylation domain-containing protein